MYQQSKDFDELEIEQYSLPWLVGDCVIVICKRRRMTRSVTQLALQSVVITLMFVIVASTPWLDRT